MVTSFYGLTYASVISIYMMIINVFKMIFSTLQNSIAASFGDLIASNDREKVLNVFNVIQYIFTCFSIILYICLILLLLPFIKLYCSGISNVNYVYVSLAISLVFYIISYTSFLPFNMIINSAGYYGKVLNVNIVLFIFTIIFAFICCYLDFSFVYFGTGLFYLLSSIHRCNLLIKNGYNLNKKNIFRFMLVYIIIFLFLPLIDYFYNYILSWSSWIFSAFLIFSCSFFILVLYSVLFERNEFKTFLKYFRFNK